jgi:TRAP-type C4-dicarboxylate transport system permease small subunit
MAEAIRRPLDVHMSGGPARKLLIVVAGGALLGAMAIDTLAMLGRQIEVPLLGAIEIVQALVLVAASGALIVAALDGAHARVHLLLARLPERWRATFERAHTLASAVVYAALLAGSLWIAADLWNGAEESELLRIPYRPLRVIVVVALGVLAAHAMVRLVRRRIS